MTERPLSWYKKLHEVSGRKDYGYFLAEGLNTVSQITAVFPSSIAEIIHSVAVPPLLAKYPCRFIKEDRLASILTSKTPQGVAALVKVPKDIYDSAFPTKAGERIVMLDGISDPGNTGTLIRSASALGFCGVLLTNDGCDALSPKVVASSAGALFSVWLKRVNNRESVIDHFKRLGYKVIGAALNGRDDLSVLKEEKILLILGHETRGLSVEASKACDYKLCLPIDRIKAESLNVAVAGSICMYLATH